MIINVLLDDDKGFTRLNLCFRQTEKHIIMPFQELIFGFISAFIMMPICAITFNYKVALWYKKVNRIASYFSFLLIDQIKSIQEKAHFLFNRSFTAIFANIMTVARERAKAWRGAWGMPEFLPALFANCYCGRATAKFRAKFTIRIFSCKSFLASYALSILSKSQSTFHTTDIVSLGIRGWDFKSFMANRAYLFNPITLSLPATYGGAVFTRTIRSIGKFFMALVAYSGYIYRMFWSCHCDYIISKAVKNVKNCRCVFLAVI